MIDLDFKLEASDVVIVQDKKLLRDAVSILPKNNLSPKNEL